MGFRGAGRVLGFIGKMGKRNGRLSKTTEASGRNPTDRSRLSSLNI